MIQNPDVTYIQNTEFCSANGASTLGGQPRFWRILILPRSKPV